MKAKRPRWGDERQWTDPYKTRCDNCQHAAILHGIESPSYFQARCACGCQEFLSREILAYDLMTHSITHNERVDIGAAQQDIQCFGTATSAVFTAVAVATTGFTTKTKTDLSIGVITNHATTNEFTGSGLTRAAGSLGSYTAPSSLGGQFSRVVSKVFTATGSATAHGAALFDNTTVGSSNLYVEDTFSSDATLVTNDTLTVSGTISN